MVLDGSDNRDCSRWNQNQNQIEQVTVQFELESKLLEEVYTDNKKLLVAFGKIGSKKSSHMQISAISANWQSLISAYWQKMSYRHALSVSLYYC